MARIVSTKNATKKDVIIKKAAYLFTQKGFSATSMRELADHIGVEASSLYNHIGSKNELLQTICFNVANDFTAQLNQIAVTDLTFTQKWEQIIRFHINMMLNHYEEVFVANHEWKQLEDPFLSNFLHQRKLYESRLVEWINAGIQKKEFRNIDAHVAVLTILSAVRGLEFWHRHKKNINIKKLESAMLDHLLFGLIKK
jgi:AcrR family transcriptional regulator